MEKESSRTSKRCGLRNRRLDGFIQYRNCSETPCSRCAYLLQILNSCSWLDAICGFLERYSNRALVPHFRAPIINTNCSGEVGGIPLWVTRNTPVSGALHRTTGIRNRNIHCPFGVNRRVPRGPLGVNCSSQRYHNERTRPARQNGVGFWPTSLNGG